jgi:hypothetical protein
LAAMTAIIGRICLNLTFREKFGKKFTERASGQRVGTGQLLR